MPIPGELVASSIKQAFEDAERSRRLPVGYFLPPGQTMKDVFRVDAELLASEGIDLDLERQRAPKGSKSLSAPK